MRQKRIVGSQKQAADAYVPADGIELVDCAAGGETQVNRELEVKASVLAFFLMRTGRILMLV